VVEFEPGVEWNFEPTGSISRANNNDRAFLLHNDEGFSGLRPISGAIDIGSSHFDAAQGSDGTSDLVPGDWLLVQETDRGLGDIVAIDWAQLKSVSDGACGKHCVVNLQRPIRTSFRNNHNPSTLAFSRITNYVHDVELRCNGALIQSSQAKVDTPGVAVGVVHGAVVEGCVANIANGQALYSYRSSDVTFRNNRVIGSGFAASEFAATTDLSLEGNSFGYEGTPISQSSAASSAALSIDFGTSFFNVIGNKLISGSDIMLQILYGVHDGVITGNNFGFTGIAGLSVGQGVSAVGVQHVLFSGNVLDGGVTGEGNTAIAFASFSGGVEGSQPISSDGNVISNNILHNYTHLYGELLAGDSYVDLVNRIRFGSLGAAANGSTLYCSDCTVAMPDSCTNVTRVAACTCKAGGTGAVARRISGTWLCN
jgi:hypothetical protein